jgi:hypothetical protein
MNDQGIFTMQNKEVALLLQNNPGESISRVGKQGFCKTKQCKEN